MLLLMAVQSGSVLPVVPACVTTITQPGGKEGEVSTSPTLYAVLRLIWYGTPASVFVAYVLSASALFSFLASSAVMVAAKLESLPRAFASSFNVFSWSGALSTRAARDLATNSVLAMALLELPSLAVGTVVWPVTV